MDLPAGQVVYIDVGNFWNSYAFKGQKQIIMSTTSWIGGKNDFLGIAYIVVGCICLFLSLVFTIIVLARPREFGDPSYLSWNKYKEQ